MSGGMSETVKLAFTGDVMCGDSFSLLGRGAASMIDRYGADFVPEVTVRLLRSHDLVLGNIECVLSDVGRREYSLRRLHMRGRPQTAFFLAQWGFTVGNVANNHILEQGLSAAADTAGQMKKAGLEVIGCGPSGDFRKGGTRLTRMVLKGQVFYLAGICLRQERYAFEGDGVLDDVLDKIRQVRREEPSAVVILSVHWGDELIEYPSVQQRQLADRFEKAGVHLVVGHHPHVVQGIDARKDSLIAYSLGNFIFDSYSEKTSWSVLFSVEAKDGRICSWKAIPIVRGEDFRPFPAPDEKRTFYEQEIARRNRLACEAIENPIRYDREYRRQVSVLCQESRRNLRHNLFRRFFRFSPVFWPQILLRPIQRRLGVW